MEQENTNTEENKDFQYGVSYSIDGEQNLRICKTREDAESFANFLDNAKEICIIKL